MSSAWGSSWGASLGGGVVVNDGIDVEVATMQITVEIEEAIEVEIAQPVEVEINATPIEVEVSE